MAALWIKMRVDLADDPAVIAIAARLEIDEDTVVGKLHRAWSWADRQTVDGFAQGVTAAWIDRHLRCPGFADAMAGAGWLELSDTGVRFPKFERHNGESAKRRAATASRVRRLRESGNASCNAGCVTESATREEEIREEETGETSRVDLIEIGGCGGEYDYLRAEWSAELSQKVLAFCAGQFKSRQDPLFPGQLSLDDRRFLLKLGALCVAGAIPEVWVASAAEAIRRHTGAPISNRLAYLTRVLQEQADAAGTSLNRLLVMVVVPDAVLHRRAVA